MLVTLIKENERNLIPMEGVIGEAASISRDIHHLSDTMGGGFAHLKKATLDWQIKYDEIIYVVSGSMYILENGNRKDATQGDVYFMKNGVDITYGTDDEVVFFYTIYPGNWKERLQEL